MGDYDNILGGMGKRDFAEMSFSQTIGGFLIVLMMKYSGNEYYGLPINEPWFNNMTRSIDELIKIAKSDKDSARQAALSRFKSCFKKTFFKPKFYFYPCDYVRYAQTIQEGFKYSGLKSQLQEMEKIIREK